MSLNKEPPRPGNLTTKLADRDHLRRLSRQANRIASTLAKLSTASESEAEESRIFAPSEDLPEVSLEQIQAAIAARRLRQRYFASELFGDPAWDMLLELLHAEIGGFQVSVSSLCAAAGVPPTTALRWLKNMTKQGIFLRRSDPDDGRRVFVELAPDASRAMRNYFAEIGASQVI